MDGAEHVAEAFGRGAPGAIQRRHAALRAEFGPGEDGDVMCCGGPAGGGRRIPRGARVGHGSNAAGSWSRRDGAGGARPRRGRRGRDVEERELRRVPRAEHGEAAIARDEAYDEHAGGRSGSGHGVHGVHGPGL